MRPASAARGDEWPRRAEAWGSLYRHDLALREASGEPAERGLRRAPAGRGLSHLASRRRPSPRRPTGSGPASASRSSSRAGAAPCRQTGQAPHEARAAFLVPSWCLLGAEQARQRQRVCPGRHLAAASRGQSASRAALAGHTSGLSLTQVPRGRLHGEGAAGSAAQARAQAQEAQAVTRARGFRSRACRGGGCGFSIIMVVLDNHSGSR